jgi:hypothetical protein
MCMIVLIILMPRSLWSELIPRPVYRASAALKQHRYTPAVGLTACFCHCGFPLTLHPHELLPRSQGRVSGGDHVADHDSGHIGTSRLTTYHLDYSHVLQGISKKCIYSIQSPSRSSTWRFQTGSLLNTTKIMSLAHFCMACNISRVHIL